MHTYIDAVKTPAKY